MKTNTQSFSFEALLENSHEMIVLIDKNSNAVYISPSVARQLGYDFYEIIGSRTVDYLHPDDKAIQAETLRKCIENPGKAFKHRVRIKRMDDTYFWAESTFTNFLDRPGVNGIVINFRDIDEEKKALDLLKQNEEKYRVISELVSDFVYGMNLNEEGNSELEFISHNFTKLIGYTPEQISNKGGLFSIVYPNDMEIAVNHVSQILKGNNHEAEFRIINAKGEIIWLNNHVHPEFDLIKQKVTRLVGVGKNISVRKKAESQLLRVLDENKLMEKALNQLSTLVYIKDINKKYIRVNKSMLDFLGKNENEILGHFDHEFYSAEEYQPIAKSDAEIFESKQGINCDIELTDSLGRKRLMFNVKTPLLDSNGNVWGICGVCTDITELKNIRHALDKSEAMVREMSDNAPSAVVLLNDKMQFIHVSNSTLPIMGYTLADVQHIDPAELTHPDDNKWLNPKLLDLLSNPGSTFTATYRFKHKNGEWRYIQSTFSNLLQDGLIQSIYIHFYDVSDRINAEDMEFKLKQVAEQSPQGIVLTDLEGNIEFINDLFCQLNEIQIKHLIGKNINQIGLICLGENENQISWNEILKGNLILKEICYNSGMPNERFVLMKISAVFENEGKIKNVVLRTSDITSSKKLENELKLSEAKFSKAFKLSPNIMSISDFDTYEILDVNETYLSKLEYSKEEVIGKNVGDLKLFISEDTRAKLRESLNKSNVINNFEAQIRTKSGVILTGLINGTLFEHNNRRILLIIFIDNTEGNKLLTELKNNEYLLAESQRVGLIGSYRANLTKGFWTSSKVLDDIFGLSHSIQNKEIPAWVDLIHEEDKQMMVEYLQNEIIGKQNNFDKEYRIVTKNNGVIKWVHGIGEIRKEPNTGDLILIGTIQDISIRKSHEAEELKNVESLRRRNKELEEFSFIISHHLRSPLANILGISELIVANESQNSELNSLSTALSVSALKMDQVIDDLNHILYIRKSELSNKVYINLQNIFDDVWSRLSREMSFDNVTVEVDFEEANTIFSVNSYITTIFENIITNSIQFKSPNIPCIIKIKSYKTPQYYLINFVDNGLGIDLKRHSEIFGLYKKYQNPDKKSKGMGLYLVKSQIEALGGHISVESQPGEGATFTVKLPLI